MSNRTFHFSAVVTFKIEESEAASLLVENGGDKAVGEWLSNHFPELEESYYNAEQVRASLGKHLANRKVEECRHLTMSCQEPL